MPIAWRRTSASRVFSLVALSCSALIVPIIPMCNGVTWPSLRVASTMPRNRSRSNSIAISAWLRDSRSMASA
ncbi:hypothetical protein ASE90_18815 [Sphingomonas sp. Leaf67]|nr:hypothetical protein ASE90_18815 [Sphingomonas sp. Leaf67]